MLSKLFKALSRSRSSIADAFNKLAGKRVTPESLETLEEQLLSADLGYITVESILDVVERHSKSDFIQKVNEHLVNLLPGKFNPTPFENPTILLVVGVNGTGKTTTAAKLAHLYKKMGQTVTLIAADTYRAAAVDQLKIWGNRVGCNLVCNEKTAEPTSVLFDGLESARANKSDVVIVDTAGRLHTYSNLMAELAKMYRVVENRFPEFTLRSLIVMDASLGQNSIIQAKEFGKHVKLDGAILTKLDGTARGGIVFPLFQELGIPVEFIGIGEDLYDLEHFDPNAYVDGLLGLEQNVK
ncbi:MAG: signal recognition particle-docking protein FtsY [Candidatus Marinimicrobia bacterium]|nr:signal recognition particle-docking protein FtsY [Candidatus Neomarinimicrobiota bacterium]MBT3946154.1 signal recognition particle-docking protein FtsY [Candidatus Neomarinimicrobiota bacterium]MBT4154501.1 signal recognition particle-docking protein FtsY [Candidatus Neomarinimicrobiota bacterium]MBT4555117.1 signal recognition particle-docking protein FtsY [Candidatus Neomarinimicrobiota bacterium]MBT4753539.1 signal recognition particle-docking protein FtsY [Candidatus Neomarinimicrobiota